jgi:hypothetical protein
VGVEDIVHRVAVRRDISYYAPQFVTAVRDARVHSVMASYNAVNGVPASANSISVPACILFAAASEALEAYPWGLKTLYTESQSEETSI